MASSSIRVTGAVLSTVLAGGLLSALPAQAASAYQGRVTATGGLTVRHLPTTASAAKGTVAKGTTVEIICKTRGSTVAGNDVWYLLPPTLNEWVSARYVVNLGPVPRWCGTSQRFVGKGTTKLIKRAAPTKAGARIATVPKGVPVSIVCQLPAQDIKGNKLWYALSDGRWVSAYYVTVTGATPGYCT